jgi:hypothetical protein
VNKVGILGKLLSSRLTENVRFRLQIVIGIVAEDFLYYSYLFISIKKKINAAHF